MSKLNQIQSELKQINSAKFQELCDSYLYKKGYSDIEPFGSMVGKEKTVKGTPDSYIRLPNGNYIFIEYTTNESNLFSKLEKDLDGCFDEKKTGIHPSRIEKIIVCHNLKLSPHEEEQLAEKCAVHRCSFEQIGIGRLSLALSQDYPGIAKDFLGIEIDTRQILSPREFIEEYQKNAFATRLDIAFHFREEELKTLAVALENQDLVIVAGRAGVGKSRLALESCRKFSELYPSFKTFCIFNKTLPLYDDLKTYFSPDGDYLILVDDANRLSQLDNIFRLLNDKRENHRIKIIVTVRDYALNKVKKTAHDYLNREIISLEPLKSDQIKELVTSEFGIKNPRYLDRIKEIASGNPRLAVMAAQVAVRENKFESIVDATSLYDEYFNSIDNKLNESGNENLLKVAGIISFFSALDRSQQERFSQIAESFGIAEEELWEAVIKLHKLETVELYEDEVAKISDQVLATYLFYKVFFRDELLDFSVLLKKYSETYRFDDAVFPVINTFNSDAVRSFLQRHIDNRWEEIAGDEKQLLQLADKFWFLKQTDTLWYLKEKIDALPQNDYQLSKLNFEPSKDNVTDKYLGVLENFQRAAPEDFRIALELIFSYFEKRTEVLPQVLYLLLERFCFHVRSYNYGYYVQKTVIDFLIEKTNDESNGDFYRKILLSIAGKYLQTYFHSGWMETRRTYSYTNFGLIACPEIFEIRTAILLFLVSEYTKAESSNTILQIIADYSNNIYEKHLEEETNAIAAEDAKTLIPFLTENLNSASYVHCAVAQKYFQFLEKRKAKFDKTFKTRFVNETYRISKILTPERFELYGLSMSDRDKYKRRVINKFFGNYSFEDYVRFFESCREIAIHQERHNAYQFEAAIGTVINNLAETNPALFKQVFEHIFATGNTLNHLYPLAIQDLLSLLSDPREVYDLLQKHDYNLKSKWLFTFLTGLNAEQVNEFYLNELYSLYQNADLREVTTYFDHLAFYEPLDAKLIPNIVKILFERMKQANVLISFDMLFNPHTNSFKKLKELFKDDWDLLKKVYLHEALINKHADYRSEALQQILEVEQKFIVEYLEWLYENNERLSKHDSSHRYSALWDMDEYESVLSHALEFIYQKEKTEIWVFESYANVFFIYESKTGSIDDEGLIAERKVKFIADYIKEHHKDSDRMKFIFDAVVNSFPSKRRDFLEIFLRYNENYDDFEKIRIEPLSWGGMGSMIPVLEQKVNFLESLVSLFSGIEFLKHKIYVNNEILRWKRKIEIENKKEFIDEF